MATNGLVGMLFAAIGFIAVVLMCSSETNEKVQKIVAKEKR